VKKVRRFVRCWRKLTFPQRIYWVTDRNLLSLLLRQADSPAPTEGGLSQLLRKKVNMRAHIYIIALLLLLTLAAYILLRFA
jgi:hypothetical protein